MWIKTKQRYLKGETIIKPAKKVIYIDKTSLAVDDLELKRVALKKSYIEQHSQITNSLKYYNKLGRSCSPVKEANYLQSYK